MKVAELTHDRLEELLGRLASARIAVVGDYFLDKYLEVDPELEELSVETGLPAHQVRTVRTAPGCAGVVVANLASLGVKTLHAVGSIGDDGEGYELRKRLNELGCKTECLQANDARMTPTYLKPRNINDASLAGEHSRYDSKNRTETPAEAANQIVADVDSLLADVDAVMIMDQVEQRNCGGITDDVREALCERAAKHKRDVIFWADSRRRIREFTHVIIKPNEFEAIGREHWLPGEEVDEIELRVAVDELRQRIDAPIVVTRGSRGMLLTDPEWTRVRGVHVPTPIDPTGAGDSVSASVVAALCSGATISEAAVIGNLVASITIQQLATTGVARPYHLPERLTMWHEQA